MENNTVFKSNSYFKCGTLERETCLGDDLVVLLLHDILNSAHNGVGADAVLFDEHLRRAGSWHLADREALQSPPGLMRFPGTSEDLHAWSIYRQVKLK